MAQSAKPHSQGSRDTKRALSHCSVRVADSQRINAPVHTISCLECLVACGKHVRLCLWDAIAVQREMEPLCNRRLGTFRSRMLGLSRSTHTCPLGPPLVTTRAFFQVQR